MHVLAAVAVPHDPAVVSYVQDASALHVVSHVMSTHAVTVAGVTVHVGLPTSNDTDPVAASVGARNF